MSEKEIEHSLDDALDSDDEDADWDKSEETEDITKHTEEDEQQFRRAIDDG
jgi:hypothetical protein|tara:strand:+ start:741 stop:893 length:153 start_codon:yes stop_codon:yes gene_type:complete